MSETQENPSIQLDSFLNYSFHELRNPLTVVSACAQLAFDKLPNGAEFERLRRIMRQMLDQSEELVAMLEEFLEVSRLQANKLQLDTTEIEVRELCEQTLMHLNATQQQRVALELPSSDQRMNLEADGTRLETALFILLDLGLKITPPPTSVKMKIDPLSNGQIAISVIMTGLQPTEAEEAQMFDPNFIIDHSYTKLKAGRSGVGLFVARGIVEAHGGKLDYDASLPGFKIKLAATPVPAHYQP